MKTFNVLTRLYLFLALLCGIITIKFDNFLNVLTINLIYVFTFCILIFFCVSVCVWAAVSAGLSLAVPAYLT